jgi:hypothetical protein
VRLPTIEELEDLIGEMRQDALIVSVKERVQWPARQPQPTTPLRGDVALITFALYRFARSGHAPAPVQKLYDTFGPYHVKPKRGSRGIIWNNQPFWWSKKGYYRPGFARGPRRPLQHRILENYHRGSMPPMHEIFFRDRDRHNFSIDNLELLSKAELHKRTVALGEVRQISQERRMEIAGRRWMRASRRGTELLLANFQSVGNLSHTTNKWSLSNARVPRAPPRSHHARCRHFFETIHRR